MLSHNLTTLDLILISLLVVCVIYLYDRQTRIRKLLPYKSKLKSVKILSVVAGENLDMTGLEKALYSTDISYNLLPYASVTQESFLAELAKGVTVAEISSHGLNGSFRFGNTSLPISWLSQALTLYPSVECVLLLYCKSYIDLSAITSIGKCSVGLIDDVTDTSCILFCRQFYFYLNKNFSYKEAFERARLTLPVNEYAKFIFSEGE